MLALALAAGALAFGVPAAGADTSVPALPLGTDGHGVHLDARRVGPRPRRPVLVLTFDDSAASLYRQVAGRTLDVECSRVARRTSGFDVTGGGGVIQRAPRRRRPIVVGFLAGYDYCSVGVVNGRRTRVLTWIPLTPRGAVLLDKRATAQRVIAAIRMLARPERPSAADVAARFHGVALAAPTDTPPPGVLGVFSDGAEHVYAAQADRAGELLFVELDHDVTRTDITDSLIGEDGLS